MRGWDESRLPGFTSTYPQRPGQKGNALNSAQSLLSSWVYGPETEREGHAGGHHTTIWNEPWMLTGRTEAEAEGPRPLPTKVRPVKATVFPVVMYGCERWTMILFCVCVFNEFIFLPTSWFCSNPKDKMLLQRIPDPRKVDSPVCRGLGEDSFQCILGFLFIFTCGQPRTS